MLVTLPISSRLIHTEQSSRVSVTTISLGFTLDDRDLTSGTRAEDARSVEWSRTYGASPARDAYPGHPRSQAAPHFNHPSNASSWNPVMKKVGFFDLVLTRSPLTMSDSSTVRSDHIRCPLGTYLAVWFLPACPLYPPQSSSVSASPERFLVKHRHKWSHPTLR